MCRRIDRSTASIILIQGLVCNRPSSGLDQISHDCLEGLSGLDRDSCRWFRDPGPRPRCPTSGCQDYWLSLSGLPTGRRDCRNRGTTRFRGSRGGLIAVVPAILLRLIEMADGAAPIVKVYEVAIAGEIVSVAVQNAGDEKIGIIGYERRIVLASRSKIEGPQKISGRGAVPA